MLACALVLACAASVAQAPAATAASTVSLASESSQFLSSQLAAYAGPFGPFASGVWTSQNTVCWACNNGGPASAAAVLYELSGQSRPDLLREAEQTIDTAIATRQAADGSFQAPPNTGDGQGAGTSTMFFGVEFGTAYYELRSVLDPARRARWQQSLAAAADYLIRTDALQWYTNGNINLGITEFFYLVWQATGNRKYQQAYETEWSLTLSPPQANWPGAGLVIAKAPTKPDASDGAGYLAEIGAGGTGFDPEYSELQLDVASRLYLLSRDPRALRVANLLVNMLLPRVDSSWYLDTSGGTRHPALGRKVEFLSSALAVLSLTGGRQDLTPLAHAELQAEELFYGEWWQAYNPVFRRGLGNDVAVVALAAAGSAPGAAPSAAPGLTTGSSPPAASPGSPTASSSPTATSASPAPSHRRHGHRVTHHPRSHQRHHAGRHRAKARRRH